ncbi:TPA: PP0621 family protein, partial [Burkholderia cenocepacia]
MRQILLLILLFFAGSWLARKLRHAQEQAQARAGRGAGYDGAPGAGAGAARPNGDARSLPEPMV